MYSARYLSLTVVDFIILMFFRTILITGTTLSMGGYVVWLIMKNVFSAVIIILTIPIITLVYCGWPFIKK